MSDKSELKLGHPLHKKATRKTPKPGYGTGYAAGLHRLQSLADELAAALEMADNAMAYHNKHRPDTNCPFDFGEDFGGTLDQVRAALAKYDEAKS